MESICCPGEHLCSVAMFLILACACLFLWYLLHRPMKIRKSTWKDLDIKGVQKKEKNKRKMQESLGLV